MDQIYIRILAVAEVLEGVETKGYTNLVKLGSAINELKAIAKRMQEETGNKAE